MAEQAPAIVPVLKGKRWDGVVASYDQMTVEGDGDDELGQVWSGHISKLVGELGFHASTGTQIVDDLERIASIEVLERGARGKLTRIKLLAPPDEEKFLNYKDGISHQPLKRDAEIVKKQELDASLLERVNRLEEINNVLVDEFQKLYEAHEDLKDKFRDHVMEGHAEIEERA